MLAARPLLCISFVFSSATVVTVGCCRALKRLPWAMEFFGLVAHLRFILFLNARGTSTVTRQTLGATACSLDRKL